MSLGACAGLPGPPPGSFAAVPIGTAVRLTGPLEVAGHRSRIYLQGGAVTRAGLLSGYGGSVDEYYPHCYLRVSETGGAQRLEPAAYRVTGKWHLTELRGLTLEMPEIRLTLEGPGPIRALVCRETSDFSDHDTLTLREVRAALGEWIILEPPGGDPSSRQDAENAKKSSLHWKRTG